MMENSHKNLNSWRSKVLSCARRLVLFQTCFGEYASLYFNVFVKRSNLLWGISFGLVAFLIRWEIVYLPKEEGGLGIRWISEVNEAWLMKLGWQAASSSLWAKWFKNRYFRNSSLWHHSTRNSGSCIWISIHLLPSSFEKMGGKSAMDAKSACGLIAG